MKPQKQDFNTLCDILELIIDSYQQKSFIPAWLLQRLHPSFKQAQYIKNKISVIKQEAIDDHAIPQLTDQLIKTLDEMHYFLSIHTSSKRLCSKVQDALLEALFFEHEHAVKYQQIVVSSHKINEFLNYLDRSEEIISYKNYYKKQHSIYGRFINRYSDEEITLAAKRGMINGKLVEFYGIKGIIGHGLHYIRLELNELRKKKIAINYLSLEAINGYIEKMDFLLHPANEIQHDETALVQNARYILDDIINAAGTDEQAKAKYRPHQFLVNACFWVDEMFKDARGIIDAEIVTNTE